MDDSQDRQPFAGATTDLLGLSEAEMIKRYIAPAMKALIERAAAGTLTEEDRKILSALPSGRLLQDQQNDFTDAYRRSIIEHVGDSGQ